MVTIDGVENMSNNGLSIDVEKGKNYSAQRKAKQFDIVEGSCHDINTNNRDMKCLSHKSTLEAMMKDWRILESNLPESIYVRAYEERIDLMEVMIIGSSGTPYHNGLFFFEMELLRSYPRIPPRVHYKYHLSGFGLNPNINPLTGSLKTYPTWNPKSSTILDVLLYLQGLLCEKPYYSISRDEYSEEASQIYDYNAFLASCNTMIRVMNHPPEHFKDIVEQHFRTNGDVILRACNVYSDGRARVGSYDQYKFDLPRKVEKKMLNVYSQLNAAFNEPVVCSLKISCLKFIEYHTVRHLLCCALLFLMVIPAIIIIVKYDGHMN
ncbi:hypothetical protein ACFE04_023603 [Oxalis oulophora]